jgi:hypothetical protein
LNVWLPPNRASCSYKKHFGINFRRCPLGGHTVSKGKRYEPYWFNIRRCRETYFNKCIAVHNNPNIQKNYDPMLPISNL